ncbi:helix-turn-helix domain-containing protein [Algibacter pectinivorans]|uniref:Regulatory protein, luxR family n=1 Tax=Algibacter pectinivorans TaxID=870482 RepID=A0A1I1R8W5_9FLAO|nr:helix-turn-helix transcriptional regulator [Algibacter pectinivorans]SFD30597.1 regulatory protein, luxR family [Algibacter pectinivorans]
MLLYKSDFLNIFFEEEQDLYVQKWSNKAIGLDQFKIEMLNFVSVYKKHQPKYALWLQKEFSLIIDKEAYGWIEEHVNRKCFKDGNEKCAFVVGKDVFSHVTIVDSFNESENYISIKHFLTEKEARSWLFQEKEERSKVLKPKVVFQKVDEKGDLVFKIENSKNAVDEALMLFMDDVGLQQFSKQNLPKLLSLTKREKQVFELIADGKTGVQVAEILFISKNTSRTHWRNIKVKLAIKSSKDVQMYHKIYKLNKL